jgi:uncharacterized membrane protein YfcA
LAGSLGAILGIGGGIFLVPALVLLFGLPMPVAIATGLISVIATSSATASVNVESETANMKLGMVLELATVAGALLGALGAKALAPRILIGLFGAVLAAMSLLLWRGNSINEAASLIETSAGALDGSYFDPAAGRRISYKVQRLPIGLVASLTAGALSGMLGIGGGFLKVPVMHLYCQVPMKAAAATSNFMIGVTAAAGAFLYLGRGEVEPVSTAAVVLGVLAGSAGGCALNTRIQDRSLRKAFAGLLAILSVQMLQRAFLE